MSKFNPDFWEVTISQESWQRFSTEVHQYNEEPGEVEKRHEQTERAKALWPRVRAVMGNVLTARQREVLYLYFFEGLNQREIGQKLGISQQSVSEHLYGKTRNGRAVGGALPKLRKACAKRGVRWD
jgi:RNA polymerase sigma factor (sigma-70 family)